MVAVLVQWEAPYVPPPERPWLAEYAEPGGYFCYILEAVDEDLADVPDIPEDDYPKATTLGQALAWARTVSSSIFVMPEWDHARRTYFAHTDDPATWVLARSEPDGGDEPTNRC